MTQNKRYNRGDRSELESDSELTSKSFLMVPLVRMGTPAHSFAGPPRVVRLALHFICACQLSAPDKSASNYPQTIKKKPPQREAFLMVPLVRMGTPAHLFAGPPRVVRLALHFIRACQLSAPDKSASNYSQTIKKPPKREAF